MAKGKPKVSTKTVEAREKKNKILMSIEGHPEGVFPKIIHVETGINTNTIKSALKELIKEGSVKQKKIRGLYYITEKDTHGLEDYNFQNLVITFKTDKIDVKNQIDDTEENEFFKIRITVGVKSKKVTLHFSTDYPIPISAFPLMLRFTQGLIKDKCGIFPDLNDLEIPTCELNIDHFNIRLERECITIDSIIGLYKIYNKRNCVRGEHKIKAPITADIIHTLLKNGLVTAEVMDIAVKDSEDTSKIKRDILRLRSAQKSLLNIVTEIKKKVDFSGSS